MVVDSPQHAATALNYDLGAISNWADTWLVDFNPSKTDSLIISRKVNKPFHPPLIMNNTVIAETSLHKHLGLYFSSNLERTYSIHL